MTTGALQDRLRLMILTDPAPACGRPLADVVEACAIAGATAVQLRLEGVQGGDLYREALLLREVTRRHGTLFVVNDRFDVALAADADGTHLGPRDIPVHAVRRHVPDDFVIGYSTDDPDEAPAARDAGADYLGVGAVYGTTSKAGLGAEEVGPDRVRRVLDAAGLPGVGIGGITPDNARAVYRTGAGVAVLGAVMGADDPATVVRRIAEASEA
jgi:thiamine-phosphate pyrophosphorylase